jgi:hypothetical protein
VSLRYRKKSTIAERFFAGRLQVALLHEVPHLLWNQETTMREQYPAPAQELEYPTAPVDLIALIRQALDTRPIKSYALPGDRKLYRGMRGSRIYSFPSEKAGGTLTLQGELEFAHAIYLERAAYVANYRAQSPRIPYLKTNNAFPDFVVETVHHTFEIHEIKPNLQQLSDKDKLKFCELEKLLLPLGIEFKKFDTKTLLTKKQATMLSQHYQIGNLRSWTEHEINLSQNIICRNIHLTNGGIYKLLEEHNLSTALLDYHLFKGVRDLFSVGRGL